MQISTVLRRSNRPRAGGLCPAIFPLFLFFWVELLPLCRLDPTFFFCLAVEKFCTDFFMVLVFNLTQLYSAVKYSPWAAEHPLWASAHCWFPLEDRMLLSKYYNLAVNGRHKHKNAQTQLNKLNKNKKIIIARVSKVMLVQYTINLFQVCRKKEN